jgi:hypothetical protein
MHYWNHCWIPASADAGFGATAFVALAIGIPTLLIAYNQYRVGAAKLKFELFDKRYAIFQKTWEILSEVVMKGTREKHYGLATPFNNFLPEASFLFGKDIQDYLNDLSTKWTERYGLEAEKDGQGVDRAANAARESALKEWFFKQASSVAKEKFGRYLNFDTWK